MRLIIFHIATLCLLLTSCSEESAEQHVTDGGFEYITFSDKGGAKPQPGEFAYFTATIRVGDSTLFTTHDTGEDDMPFMPITPEGEMAPSPNPFEYVLKNMGVGDSARLVMPFDSLPQPPAGFEDESEILYDMVLMNIRSGDDHQAFMEEKAARAMAAAEEAKTEAEATYAQYKAGELVDQVKELDNGVRYILHKPGTGPTAENGDIVSVNYYGMLSENGESFDNSYQRGQPYTFPLGMGEVIDGWDLGIAGLKQGAEATLIIPSELGYQERGSPPGIPPNAELIFCIVLENVTKQ